MAQCEVTPLSLQFTVYSNGLTGVEYILEADPTLLQEDVPLIGENWDELVILDQDGFILEYEQIDTVVTVDTIGATILQISYYTLDLTKKEGSIWSFNASSPIKARITLPEGSEVIDLSDIPLAIGSDDEKTFVILSEGSLYIAYTIDVVNPGEDAQNKIDESSEYIQTAKDQGIILTDAETLLGEAIDAFQEGRFAEASVLAEQAQEDAMETVEEANTAEEALTLAQDALDSARSSGRTVGLDTADALMKDAIDAFDQGAYQTSASLAHRARDKALESEAPYNYLLPVAGVLAIASALGIFYFVRIRGVDVGEPDIRPVDLDLIFERHPDLRLDDREVIRYIAESGGELFANEIRERFDIPRTSAWRMIRRLVGMGILSERKVGGQSLVSISERYRRDET